MQSGFSLYVLVDGELRSTGLPVTLTACAVLQVENQVKRLEFQYDSNGLRTQKKEILPGKTITTDYTLNGKKITHLCRTEVDVNGNTTATDSLHFFYDAQGRPAKLLYNGTMYTYLHNLQGDIVAILDAVGTTVVQYSYDAWGKPLSTTGSMADTLGERNPFRYRGYVYDREIELYYLKSRYYSFVPNRFMSADVAENVGNSIIDKGLYTYCRNNPVIFVDHVGEAADVVLDVFSLAISCGQIATNPSDITAWYAAGADLLCLVVPFVSGGGRYVRIACKADKAMDVVKHADDLIDASKVIKSRTDLGNIMHAKHSKLFNKVDGLVETNKTFLKTRKRPDYYNIPAKAIGELKPYSKRNLKNGMKQA